MHVTTPKEGYHLNAKGIAHFESQYNAVFMGPWAIQGRHGWTEQPVDVFYVAKPDRSQGHTNYFGIFVCPVTGQSKICNAESAFSQTITGVLTDSGEVLVSRYRHDYVEKDGAMIDGGRDYVRCSESPLVTVRVQADQFVIEGINAHAQ